jgi:hypothetical protein
MLPSLQYKKKIVFFLILQQKIKETTNSCRFHYQDDIGNGHCYDSWKKKMTKTTVSHQGSAQKWGKTRNRRKWRQNTTWIFIMSSGNIMLLQQCHEHSYHKELEKERKKSSIWTKILVSVPLFKYKLKITDPKLRFPLHLRCDRLLLLRWCELPQVVLGQLLVLFNNPDQAHSLRKLQSKVIKLIGQKIN